jgi:hypothetical protein
VCQITAQEGTLAMPDARISRRIVLVTTGRVAGALTLAGGLRTLGVSPAAAQTPSLSRAGSAASVTVGPGAAAAHGAAADAVAAQGLARAQAAAALADAASDSVTTTTGTAAVAAADPAQGAMTQGAVASANATRAAEPTPAAAIKPARVRPPRLRHVRGPRHAGRQQRQQRRVKTLPATGTGGGAPRLAPWLALGSTLAAVTAFVVRPRTADPEPAGRCRGIDG